VLSIIHQNGNMVAKAKSRHPGEKMSLLHTKDFVNGLGLLITHLSHRPIANGFKVRWKKLTLITLLGVLAEQYRPASNLFWPAGDE